MREKQRALEELCAKDVQKNVERCVRKPSSAGERGDVSGSGEK